MSTNHPTREALISAVVNLMDNHEVAEITSEKVLEISKISRGSMYHHFEDFSEVVEEGLVRKYAEYVDGSILVLDSILNLAKSREEMVMRIRDVTKATQSEQVKTNRFERVAVLARAVHSHRMKLLLGREQERLTEAIADLYRRVLEKGWGNPELDPRAVAVFIQSYTIGKIVDDVTEHHMNGADWLNLIDTVLESALFPPLPPRKSS